MINDFSLVSFGSLREKAGLFLCVWKAESPKPCFDTVTVTGRMDRSLSAR